MYVIYTVIQDITTDGADGFAIIDVVPAAEWDEHQKTNPFEFPFAQALFIAI